jgi:hypothetical protein
MVQVRLTHSKGPLDNTDDVVWSVISTTRLTSLLLLLLLLQGVKVFLVAPPTPHNLACYESWAGDSSQARKWLGGSLQGCAKVLLAAGSTMLLPPGAV